MLTRRSFLAAASAVLLAGALPARAEPPRDLAELLEPVRRQAGLPALGAAVLRGDALVALGVTGVRKLGAPVLATPRDLWHLGSLTKSMTATLAGTFVQEGRLAWTTLVLDLFPELARTARPEYRLLDLQMLLTHRGGVPKAVKGLLRRGTEPLPEQRAQVVRGVLERPPESRPGTAFLYSNLGYVMAGAMLERLTGRPWEDLLRERLFRPAGMADAGFGPTGTPGRLDEPWAHRPRDGTWVPVPPGPRADNPPVLGPAGTVHCSLRDLAAYARLHAVGARGRCPFLAERIFRHLHTPWPGGTYACGWGVGRRTWAPGAVLVHTGSNTMNVARIALSPEDGTALMVVCNAGGAGEACGEAMRRLLRTVLR